MLATGFAHVHAELGRLASASSYFSNVKRLLEVFNFSWGSCILSRYLPKRREQQDNCHATHRIERDIFLSSSNALSW
jgi:hypothetical protein